MTVDIDTNNIYCTRFDIQTKIIEGGCMLLPKTNQEAARIRVEVLKKD